MPSKSGLLFIGGIIGACLLLIGQFFAGNPNPDGSGARGPDFARMQSNSSLPSVDRYDLSDVMTLPTVFARRTALHDLAAQADSDRLRELISAASQIADRSDRETALATFLRRYCDIDPRAALALANADLQENTDHYRDIVWQTWARNDLADAIFAVNTLPRHTDQASAVQSLYAAFGYMENEQTDRIFSQTGIEQSRQTRLRYLRVLLTDAPRSVVDFINSEPSRLRRDEYINWFAYALDVSDRDAAYSYVREFASPGDRDLFESTIDSRFSRLNPVDTVWRALAKDETGPNSEFHDAIEELASQDVDAAISIFEQIDSSNAKVLAAFVIANELANRNPRQAVDWLRSIEDIRTDKIEDSLLATIATSDPDFALETALALPASRRESAISTILLNIARSRPEQAALMLQSVPGDIDLSRTRQVFGNIWLTQSPTAAISWLESLESQQAEQIAEFSVRTTMITQPDTALRLLSFLDDKKAASSAGLIVAELAASGDVDRAFSYMDELHALNIAGLEPSLAAGLANHDHQRAIQFAQQLPDRDTRDTALTRVATTIAQSGENSAVATLPALVNSIENTQARSNAVRSIMMRMMRDDKERARQLLDQLSIGEDEKEVYRQIILQR